MANQNTTLLVTGASGHLGRRVIELLLASDAARGQDIIATTRTPDKLEDLGARGVDVRAASFEEPATLTAAFRGAGRVLLISTDAVDRPGRRIAQHRAAIEAAKAAGVKHVVYTSLTLTDPTSLVTIAPDHWATEQALAASGIGHSILRNNMYTDYLLHGLSHAMRAGRIVNSYGSGAVSYVTREDCARAAAAALASPFDGRRVLDVTGPAAITQSELAVIVSDVTGRPVVYEAVDASVAQAQLIANGLPERFAELLVSFERSAAKGQLAVSSPAVKALTGLEAMGVREFLGANRAALLG